MMIRQIIGRRAGATLALLLVAGLLAGCGPLAFTANLELPGLLRQTSAEEPPAIEATGSIEAEQVIIASELEGRIEEIYVREGDAVSAGDPLVQLDTRLLDAQLAQAEAAVASARAELEQVRAGPRAGEVARAEAALAQAEAGVAGARQRFDDAVRLRDNPVALDAQIRTAQSQVQVAQASVDRAQAELSEAKVRYEASLGGGSDIEKTTTEILRLQVEAAQAKVDLANMAVEGAGQTVAALQRLRANPASLYAGVNQARMAHEMAQREAEVKRAELALLTAGPRPEQIALAERNVDMAQKAVDALVARRQLLTLRAPMAGVVSSAVAHAGESAVAGATLLTLSDLSQVRLLIYVPADQIGWAYVGQPAEVRVDAYPDRTFAGTVVRIATQAEYTPRSAQTREELADTVFAVRIELDNPDGILKPGLPADATLRRP